jgi:SNF2-related domain
VLHITLLQALVLASLATFRANLATLCVPLQTIEVLANILTHAAPKPATPKSLKQRLAALPKRSCVSCNACGTHANDPEDPAVQHHIGTWVECDGCHAWMHGSCIGIRGDRVPNTVICAGCMRDLCGQKQNGVAKATLIICPEAIQKQWFDEIHRHVEPGKLKVVTYAGQKSSLLSSAQGAMQVECLSHTGNKQVLRRKPAHNQSRHGVSPLIVIRRCLC